MLQLDEEVEGMESTICALQQQLKETKQKCQNLVEEVETLRSITDHTRSSQHDLKRTYEVGGSDITDTDKKRAKSMIKGIENDATCTDGGKRGIRTDTYTEEELRLIKRNPNNFSSRNPYSGNKLLPSDEEMTVDDGEERLGTDDTFDATKTQKLNVKKEGSNGEVFDS